MWIALAIGCVALFAELFYFAFGDGIWDTSDAFLVPIVALVLPLTAGAIAIAALAGWNTRRAEGSAHTVAVIALILGLAVVATWGLWILMTMLVVATVRPSPQPCNFTCRASGSQTCCNDCGSRPHTGGCCNAGACCAGSPCCGGSGEGGCCGGSGGGSGSGGCGSCCGSSGDETRSGGGCCSSSSDGSSTGSGGSGCCNSSSDGSGSSSGGGGCCGSSSGGSGSGSNGGGCCGSSSSGGSGGSGGSKGAPAGGAVATVAGLAGALGLRSVGQRMAWPPRWTGALAHHPDAPEYAQDCYRIAGVRLCIGCFTTFPLFALLTPVLASVAPAAAWAPMLAGGLALAGAQGISALGLARQRWQKVAVKASLGIGLAATVVALRNAPWPAAGRAAAILALAGLAYASTLPRRRRMQRAEASADAAGSRA